MRVSATAIILLALTAAAASAQPAASSDVAPLSALRTPASPAFTLLGIEPSAVERPTSPADFATTLLTQAKDFSSLPKNFAIEASPYWLASHPRLRWQDDDERSIGASIQRTTTISFATAPIPKTTDTTGLGIGIRSSLWSGHLSANTRMALQALAASLGQQGALFLAMMYRHGLGELDEQLRRCATRAPAEQATCVDELKYDDKKQQIAQVVLDSDEFKRAAKKATALAISREGFTVDVAAAWTWTFAGDSWDNHRFSKGGFWATPGYQSGHFTALGVVRYVRDAVNTAQSDAMEAGGRGIYSTDEATLSLEYVKRTVRGTTVDGSFRLVAVAEHKVSDAVWLTASFGRDRNRPDSPGSLLAQFGLSFNLSRDRYKFD